MVAELQVSRHLSNVAEPLRHSLHFCIYVGEKVFFFLKGENKGEK
jgi:hypothetical protein